MNKNDIKTDPEKPSLSQYFSHTASASSDASFFDQISTGNGPAMMASVRESVGSQDFFQSASAALTSTTTCQPTQTTATVTSTVITEGAVHKHLTSAGMIPEISASTRVTASTGSKVQDKMLDGGMKTPVKEEPVVCRIFSSQETPSDNPSMASGKSFFDMLGSGTVRSPHSVPSPSVASALLGIDLMIPGLPTSSSASSMMTSPDCTTTTDGSCLTPSSLTAPTPTGDTMESLMTDETFTKASGALHPSEADRRRDAWITSERTRHALITAATSPPSTYFPERDLLTMPGVVLEEEMVDTVHEVVSHYLGEGEAAKRKVLTMNDVTQDERGLRELIQAGCFRAAVNLTGQLLTIYGQGAGRAGHPSKHTVHSIQLWFTRFALLVKLRSFSLAEVESEPFGDLDHPDLYFQFYPELYGGRVGSMVPFAFRLLLAELPQYLTKHQEALNRLHALLATVRKILCNLEAGLCEDGSPAELSLSDRNESKKLWASREARVLHSIVNCALYEKDYSLAVQVLELLLNGREWGSHHKRALQSTLGRVYLQLGDVAGAEKNFALARELRQRQSSTGGSAASDLRDLIDRGLMAVAQNAFQEAYDYFSKAYTLDASNIMLLNNMGVCLLYLGQLKEALSLLEGAVNNNPIQGLHESLLLNVCTLYELESSYCNQKKLGMLRLMSRYKGDGVGVACLKLQM
ncbi:hypothetical protein B7P43_G09795 [Cryptotermes secundus]|uniref:Uncharacterized protein n=1 Tax=Cryptotermes secundus TaxID=105785 RepID=A0A2J7PS14_9NEOP|nr:trafficking protein particle complex subunit 12 isoform X3 [Cryptotermes secundus]PNF19117.1 hypothetical protein B7P43_G09795 [Cryptotermes secundus]PNF19127.1 hypothetical protein B7P43_G09795 [Cryptotermes secundus]PNF19132.1 hypothetical protein B7P43_G09795 [Cryptotermes secundus]PNF19133.1 hypothetical protein B7P43_G09795 [Cryptotermes secundus]